MTIKILETPNYVGAAGVEQVRALQSALVFALEQQRWLEVQRLDKTCAALVNRVVAANGNNAAALIEVLSELKGVYSHLLNGCEAKVASMAV